MADAIGHLPRHPARILKAARWSHAGPACGLAARVLVPARGLPVRRAGPAGLVAGQTPVERVLLIGSMLLVLSIELLNSAVEAVIERYGPEFHELAGRAKDMGSAAVFVLMMNVLLVWGAILGPRLIAL